jgi:hypothetical protein
VAANHLIHVRGNAAALAMDCHWGRISSTVLTIFLLPLLYDWIVSRIEEKQRVAVELREVAA